MNDDHQTAGLYRHYKGNLYEVLGTAQHTETLEPLVVYKAQKDGAFWVRPRAMFFETVIIDGQEMPRFTKLTDAEAQTG